MSDSCLTNCELCELMRCCGLAANHAGLCICDDCAADMLREQLEHAVIAAAIRWNEVTSTEDEPAKALRAAVEALLGTGDPKVWSEKLALYER